MNDYIVLGLVLLVYMNLAFIISLIKKRNDIADIAWGLGFVLLAWSSFYLSGADTPQGLMVCLLVSIWGLRLSWHVHKRNKGKAEDYRYLQWRKDWGKWFYVRSYFQIYVLQGVFLFLVVLPVLVMHRDRVSSIGILEVIGVVIWLAGFYFEAVGDAQLARFIKDPSNKGKLMQSGLWAYTRHPNYFGEVTQWWGIWLIAFSSPGGALAIIGPLTITFLILKVSGVPMLEKKMAENPDFAEYKRRVSVFIPMPPRGVAGV